MSDASDQPEGSPEPEPEPEPCPSCGETIPADAPQGLCPRCVLEVAASPTEEGNPTTSQPRFEPPSLDAVRAAFPQFEILGLIGCGGMGAVFRARQPHLDRVVALKILPRELGDLPEFAERFAREGQVLAKLNHPNIVSVFDFGESEGFFFLLMEYVDGVNLRQAMRAGRFSPEQALEIVPPICEALQFAHDEGVLHRDIKPENVLLDAKGRVKIADFGIAKLLGEVAGAGPTLTRGAVPGTPQYMAPEQIEQPAQVDHRADIYSLGVVFYEMLTGELPIGRFAAPSERTGVGAEVDEIVLRSLEKEREKRQQSATQVRTEVVGVPPPIKRARPKATGVEVIKPAEAVSTAVDAAETELEMRARRHVRPGLAFALTFGGLAALVLWWTCVELTSEWLGSTEDPISAEKVDESSISLQENGTGDREGQPEKETSGAISLPEKSEDDSAEKNRQTKETDGGGEGNIEGVRAYLVGEWVPVVVILSIILGVGILFMVPGTVFAWKQLKIQKILPATHGRFVLLLSAWFWPIILATTMAYIPLGLFSSLIPLIGPILFIPIAIGTFLLSILIASLITIVWMNWPVDERRRKLYLESINESSEWGWRRKLLLHWGMIGFVFLVVFPLVLVCIELAEESMRISDTLAMNVTNWGILTLLSLGYLRLVNRIYHLPATREVDGGFAIRLRGESLPATGPDQPRRNSWAVWFIGFFLLLLVLFVGAVMIYLPIGGHAPEDSADTLAAQKSTEEKVDENIESNTQEDSAAAPSGEQSLSEKGAAADDQSIESQLVGSWVSNNDPLFDYTIFFEFSADHTWRFRLESEVLDRREALSGHWHVNGRILSQEVEESTLGQMDEEVGDVWRHEILELIENTRLVMKDKESGDLLTLDSTDLPENASSRSPEDSVGENSQSDDLLEVEQNLIGTWILPESPFGFMHFSPDRSWRYESNEHKLRMIGRWEMENGELVQEVEKSWNGPPGMGEGAMRHEILTRNESGLTDGSHLILKNKAGGQQLMLQRHDVKAPADGQSGSDGQSIEESHLVGSWLLPDIQIFPFGRILGHSGPSVHFGPTGHFHLSSDHTWRIELIDGEHTLSGHWKLDDRMLVCKAEEGAEGPAHEIFGEIVRLEILDLVEGTRLVMKEDESGDLLTLKWHGDSPPSEQ